MGLCCPALFRAATAGGASRARSLDCVALRARVSAEGGEGSRGSDGVKRLPCLARTDGSIWCTNTPFTGWCNLSEPAHSRVATGTGCLAALASGRAISVLAGRARAADTSIHGSTRLASRAAHVASRGPAQDCMHGSRFCGVEVLRAKVARQPDARSSFSACSQALQTWLQPCNLQMHVPPQFGALLCQANSHRSQSSAHIRRSPCCK